jgi:dihydroorotate dehydrogenase (fumarate)
MEAETEMTEISTKYAGLSLRSPIIAGSAGITKDADRILLAEQNGAGAAVMKSLFETEVSRTSPTPRFKILRRDLKRDRSFTLYSYEQASEWGPEEHAEEVRRIKSRVSIPLIVSIDCITEHGWRTYSKMMQEAGADALELNVSCPHGSITFRGGEVEREILNAVRIVRETVRIPIIAKLSPQLTSPLALVRELEATGVNGVTLFNRLTGIEIDVESESPIMHKSYAGHGGPWAIQYPLRWITEISPQVKIHISASSGVATGEDVVKYILAGATTVQVCTAIVMNGYEIIGELTRGLKAFMERKGYVSLDDFRGKVCSRILDGSRVDRRRKVKAKILRKIAPCESGCPISTGVQGYVNMIATRRFAEAGEIIRAKNPLSETCARVCGRLCREKCTRSMVDQSIAIAELKRFALDWQRASSPQAPQVADAGGGIPAAGSSGAEKAGCRPRRLAIVGAGPAGLAAAYDLAREGCSVTVFDSLPVPGGMLAAGIPPFRLPRDILRHELEMICAAGVEFRLSTTVGKDVSFADLLDGFGAVFVATGAYKGQSLGIPGDDLDGVIHALSFLRMVNIEGKKPNVGRRVAVIGGGDSALDAARTALRLGAEEAYILYRRTAKEMPAEPERVRQAEAEGVRIMYLINPTRIVGEKGRVRAIECENMFLGDADADGRRKPLSARASRFALDVQTVVLALGESPDLSFLPDDAGIETRNGLIVTDRFLRTRNEKVFAGGDAVRGPSKVIEAISDGKRAARSILALLCGAYPPVEEERGGVVDPIEVLNRGFERKLRIPRSSRAGSGASASALETEPAFPEEEAVEEASRCLACGCAFGCGLCQKVCIYDAVDRRLDEFVVNDNCVGCGLCVEVCPNNCISMVKIEPTGP